MTGHPRQFVRRFGQAARRRKDAAFADENVFIDATQAIGLPDLGSTALDSPTLPRMAGAFRRLLYDQTKAVVRVEVGLACRARGLTSIAVPPPSALERLVESALALPTVVPNRPDTQRRPLDAQGRRLADLYARSTTRWSDSNATQALACVEAGQPALIVEFDRRETWSLPRWATRVPPQDVGGAAVGFGRVGHYAIETWLIAPGTAEDQRLRNLRLCLLRLHSVQQATDVVVRLLRRGSIGFEPHSKAGDELTDFLNEMTREIEARSVWGVSQPALLAAMDAAAAVRTAGSAQLRTESLDSLRRQVALKVERFVERRAADRQVVVYKEGDVTKVYITGSTITNSSLMIAQRIDDARVAIQNSNVSDELKSAMTTLQEEARKLIELLPDDKSKGDVATAVETIVDEAKKANPTEFLVRAAGDALVAAGNKVKDLAAPIATAVTVVLSLLKILAPGI